MACGGGLVRGLMLWRSPAGFRGRMQTMNAGGSRGFPFRHFFEERVEESGGGGGLGLFEGMDWSHD